MERVADLAGQSKRGHKDRYRLLHGPTSESANSQSRRTLDVSGRWKKKVPGSVVHDTHAPFTRHVGDLSGSLARWLHQWPFLKPPDTSEEARTDGQQLKGSVRDKNSSMLYCLSDFLKIQDSMYHAKRPQEESMWSLAFPRTWSAEERPKIC